MRFLKKWKPSQKKSRIWQLLAIVSSNYQMRDDERKLKRPRVRSLSSTCHICCKTIVVKSSGSEAVATFSYLKRGVQGVVKLEGFPSTRIMHSDSVLLAFMSFIASVSCVCFDILVLSLVKTQAAIVSSSDALKPKFFHFALGTDFVKIS